MNYLWEALGSRLLLPQRFPKTGDAMKLTDAVVLKLKMPAGKTDHIEFDDAIAGFGLRLRKKADGSIGRTWVFQYRSPASGETKRITFGSPSTLPAKGARDHARKLHSQVGLGRDPQVEKQDARSRAKDSYKAVVTDYLEKRAAQVDAGRLARLSYSQEARSLATHLADLNPRPISEITSKDVTRALGKIAKDIAHDRARTWLIHFFSWAVREGFLEVNPAINTNKRVAEETPRDRVLSDAELSAVWRASGDSEYGKIVKLLILTGARRGEVGSITWRNELDMDNAVWNLPASRAKNRRAHSVPLSPQALEILQTVSRGDRPSLFGRNGGFRGWDEAKQALDKRIAAAWPADAKPFEPWVVHDLRRTVASGMARLGINLPVIEKVLNHQSGSFAGIVAVYQHHEFAAEKRDALNRWAAHVTGLVEGGADKIVRLQRTA